MGPKRRRRMQRAAFVVVPASVLTLVAIAAFSLDDDEIGVGPNNTTGNDRGSADSAPVSTDTSGSSATPTSVSDSAPVAPAAPTTFVETFDGRPTAPQRWSPEHWDIVVHSRDVSTFEFLEGMEAAHGPGCEPPPAAHAVSDYEDAVYQCADHMMTAINAGGYGMIYLTPNHQVDFGEGAATIRFEISTLRTSARDWWDVWITPYDDHLQLPLDLGTDVDATGPPRRAIRVGLGTENQMVAQLYEDFEAVDFGEYPSSKIPGNWWDGYETFLEPDPKRRDTFEIVLSVDHIKVGMPDYDFWWIDADLPALDWTQGVVQFGHHSYNPTKDCNEANNPRPPVDECLPNTWHWDNIEISSAVPFSIVKAEDRVADADSPSLDFGQPTPDDAMLRFAGIGDRLRVAFDDEPWVDAAAQATLEPTQEDHFASYWMPIPAGTTTVTFDGGEWYGGDWLVRDVSVWS